MIVAVKRTSPRQDTENMFPTWPPHFLKKKKNYKYHKSRARTNERECVGGDRVILLELVDVFDTEI